MNKASERQARYDRIHTTGLYLKLNIKTDSDIISMLGQVPNKQGYIKSLIREDIRKNG